MYGCKGNAAFSSPKIAYHFLAVLLHTRQQLARLATKQKTPAARRLPFRSYSFSVHENFLPTLKIGRAQKLRRHYSTR